MNNTIGERLISERNRLNVKQNELAKILGITPVTLRKYEQNENPIPSDKLENLMNKGFDAAFILTGKTAEIRTPEDANPIKGVSNGEHFETAEGQLINPDDYAWIPLYDVEVSAGNGRFLDKENILTYMSFTKHSLRKRGLTSFKDLGYVIVHGDSMASTLLPNDCLLINFAKRNPDGGIFVVRVGDTLFVKRLMKEKDHIRVISDNKIYPEWTLDSGDDFEIIGKYEWHGRYAS